MGRIQVLFCWVPAHIGIPGNEIADGLTKHALTLPLRKIVRHEMCAMRSGGGGGLDASESEGNKVAASNTSLIAWIPVLESNCLNYTIYITTVSNNLLSGDWLLRVNWSTRSEHCLSKPLVKVWEPPLIAPHTCMFDYLYTRDSDPPYLSTELPAYGREYFHSWATFWCPMKSLRLQLKFRITDGIAVIACCRLNKASTAFFIIKMIIQWFLLFAKWHFYRRWGIDSCIRLCVCNCMRKRIVGSMLMNLQNWIYFFSRILIFLI